MSLNESPRVYNRTQTVPERSKGANKARNNARVGEEEKRCGGANRPTIQKRQVGNKERAFGNMQQAVLPIVDVDNRASVFEQGVFKQTLPHLHRLRYGGSCEVFDAGASHKPTCAGHQILMVHTLRGLPHLKMIEIVSKCFAV